VSDIKLDAVLSEGGRSVYLDYNESHPNLFRAIGWESAEGAEHGEMLSELLNRTLG
jgi:hypothetical protein